MPSAFYFFKKITPIYISLDSYISFWNIIQISIIRYCPNFGNICTKSHKAILPWHSNDVATYEGFVSSVRSKNSVGSVSTDSDSSAISESSLSRPCIPFPYLLNIVYCPCFHSSSSSYSSFPLFLPFLFSPPHAPLLLYVPSPNSLEHLSSSKIQIEICTFYSVNVYHRFLSRKETG